jgi:transketolase
MLADALAAAKKLAKKNIRARIISMHTLKPLDKEVIKKAAKETRGIVTLEEHSIIGGLGSAVAEVIADEQLHVPLIRIGIPDTFSAYIGDQDFLKQKYGLTPSRIVAAVEKLFQ